MGHWPELQSMKDSKQALPGFRWKIDPHLDGELSGKEKGVRAQAMLNAKTPLAHSNRKQHPHPTANDPSD